MAKRFISSKHSKSTCGPRSFPDCNGVCGGNAIRDCNDVCYDPSKGELPQHYFDCRGNCYAKETPPPWVPDCAGVCYKNGTTPPNTLDCAGVCGGCAVEDCAGVCDGDAYEDCAGNCINSELVDSEIKAMKKYLSGNRRR